MLSSLVNLFFPKTCHACDVVLIDNELDICVECRHELPLTNYHFERPETVKKIFYGRVHLEAATALFYFHKSGKAQQLLHHLKYKGNPQSKWGACQCRQTVAQFSLHFAAFPLK